MYFLLLLEKKYNGKNVLKNPLLKTNVKRSIKCRFLSKISYILITDMCRQGHNIDLFTLNIS